MPPFTRKQARAFLDNLSSNAQTDTRAILEWSRLLAQRRAEVAASEISQNPQGHILEDPGRIVFPTTQPPAVPRRLALTSSCQVH